MIATVRCRRCVVDRGKVRGVVIVLRPITEDDLPDLGGGESTFDEFGPRAPRSEVPSPDLREAGGLAVCDAAEGLCWDAERDLFDLFDGQGLGLGPGARLMQQAAHQSRDDDLGLGLLVGVLGSDRVDLVGDPLRVGRR